MESISGPIKRHSKKQSISREQPMQLPRLYLHSFGQLWLESQSSCSLPLSHSQGKLLLPNWSLFFTHAHSLPQPRRGSVTFSQPLKSESFYSQPTDISKALMTMKKQFWPFWAVVLTTGISSPPPSFIYNTHTYILTCVCVCVYLYNKRVYAEGAVFVGLLALMAVICSLFIFSIVSWVWNSRSQQDKCAARNLLSSSSSKSQIKCYRLICPQWVVAADGTDGASAWLLAVYASKFREHE